MYAGYLSCIHYFITKRIYSLQFSKPRLTINYIKRSIMGRNLYRKEAIEHKKTTGKVKRYCYQGCLHG